MKMQRANHLSKFVKTKQKRSISKSFHAMFSAKIKVLWFYKSKEKNNISILIVLLLYTIMIIILLLLILYK